MHHDTAVPQQERLEPPAALTGETLDSLLDLVERLKANAGGSEPAESARDLLAAACHLLNYPRASLTALVPEQNALQPLAAVGLSPELERAWHTELPKLKLSDFSDIQPLTTQLQQGQPVVLDEHVPAPLRPLFALYGIRALLVVPILVEGQLTAVLVLDEPDVRREYTQHGIALAHVIARLLALGLECGQVLRANRDMQTREQQLRENGRQIDEFLSIAGHELRAPLTTIVTNIQMVKARLKRMSRLQRTALAELSGGSDVIRDMLDRAERQLWRLNRLVDDLLDTSRIRSNNIALLMERCDLVSLVQDVVYEQQQVHPTRLIVLELLAARPVPVLADPPRIRQALTNYLANALKYAPRESPMVVSLWREDGWARVAVRDSGPGIPQGEQERVWERFYRSPSINVRGGVDAGLGLGLYITRAIIESHNGQVGVESEPGAGSTFWFRLPLA